MKHSEHFILTTHTGSLPRPRALLKMYGQRLRDAPVDDNAIADAGREAMRRVVRGQIDAGIHVGNNGEQQREGFFLYAQRRMSGFGGTWNRWPRADVERYPMYKEMQDERLASREGASGLA